MFQFTIYSCSWSFYFYWGNSCGKCVLRQPGATQKSTRQSNHWRTRCDTPSSQFLSKASVQLWKTYIFEISSWRGQPDVNPSGPSSSKRSEVLHNVDATRHCGFNFVDTACDAEFWVAKVCENSWCPPVNQTSAGLQWIHAFRAWRTNLEPCITTFRMQAVACETNESFPHFDRLTFKYRYGHANSMM